MTQKPGPMALLIAGLSKTKGTQADKPSKDDEMASALAADIYDDKKDIKERTKALRAFIKATMRKSEDG